MRVTDELMQALVAGTLSPEEAAEVIELLLLDYAPEVRRRIYVYLSTSHGAVAEALLAAVSTAPSLSGAEEVPEPVLERILRDLGRYGGLLASDEGSPQAWSLLQLRRSDVILVERHGRIEAPAFQFMEPNVRYLPKLRFSVRRPNQILLARQDPWGALDWWVASNGRLDGRAPASLLDTDEEANLTPLAESVTELVG